MQIHLDTLIRLPTQKSFRAQLTVNMIKYLRFLENFLRVGNMDVCR